MTILLADMGGTTTRLALLRGDGGLQCAARRTNDSHAGPGDLLALYLRACGDPALSGACLAVAGPVGPGKVRFTNRDWNFSRAALAELLRLPDSGALRVVNDLTALALALPGLDAAQVEDLRPATFEETAGNGQALAVNFGTGFNVGPVRSTPAGPVALEAELGHAALPAGIAAALGAQADRFPSVEALFSGPGLPRLHAARTGGAVLSAPALVEAAVDDASARETITLMAQLMGGMARELVAAYMPRDGLFLAGSMARGVLQPFARTAFLHALDAPGPLQPVAAALPVRLITDDSAALGGLAALARVAQ
ncbi:glucokinase [Aquicoccus sp. SU-CL01552]|uniref:glucokinase n=1 Tax=Aquicoccus sp. SU-CL01552 TaxID=3127656 RepID=UPI00310445D2